MSQLAETKFMWENWQNKYNDIFAISLPCQVFFSFSFMFWQWENNHTKYVFDWLFIFLGSMFFFLFLFFLHWYSQIIRLIILYVHKTRVKNVNAAYKDISKHPVLKFILKSCKQGTCTVARVKTKWNECEYICNYFETFNI